MIVSKHKRTVDVFIQLTMNQYLVTNPNIQKKEKKTLKMQSDLGKRSETVGSTACIGNNVHVWLVCLLIYSNYKHGCISWRSWYYNFLGTTLQSKSRKAQMNHACCERVKVEKLKKKSQLKSINFLMCQSLLNCCENPRSFNNILSTKITPRDFSRIPG